MTLSEQSYASVLSAIKDAVSRYKGNTVNQEVTDIVGSSGELISETDIGVPEYYTQMRSWDGEGLLGANANVIFQNGVVTSKAQFGLQ